MRSRKPQEHIGVRMPGATIVWASATAAVAVWILAAIGLWLMMSLPNQQLGRLSDAGQAFGVVSAMFSAAALSGVVASVAYQSHQARNHRYEMWHTAHASLLFRVIDEPGFGRSGAHRPEPAADVSPEARGVVAE